MLSKFVLGAVIVVSAFVPGNVTAQAPTAFTAPVQGICEYGTAGNYVGLVCRQDLRTNPPPVTTCQILCS